MNNFDPLGPCPLPDQANPFGKPEESNELITPQDPLEVD